MEIKLIVFFVTYKFFKKNQNQKTFSIEIAKKKIALLVTHSVRCILCSICIVHKKNTIQHARCISLKVVRYWGVVQMGLMIVKTFLKTKISAYFI